METTGIFPVEGEPRGNAHQVGLCDPDVEVAVGEVFAEVAQLVGLRHIGRGDDKAVVGRSEFRQAPPVDLARIDEEIVGVQCTSHCSSFLAASRFSSSSR